MLPVVWVARLSWQVHHYVCCIKGCNALNVKFATCVWRRSCRSIAMSEYNDTLWQYQGYKASNDWRVLLIQLLCAGQSGKCNNYFPLSFILCLSFVNPFQHPSRGHSINNFQPQPSILSPTASNLQYVISINASKVTCILENNKLWIIIEIKTCN